ncbi:MAG: ATP-binding protein, partial [Verrucomicrobiota bacterium]
FPNVESANGHLQAFEAIFPMGNEYQYEFIRSSKRLGLILHVQVNRTQRIAKTADGTAYIRRGAQNLPQTTAEEVRRLEFIKGIISFESHPVQADKSIITDSLVIKNFLANVVPNAEPEKWLKKQILIVNDNPTVSGLLLFSEEPQAALPKRSGIKVYRYATQETEGFRDVLKFVPITIEGCIYDQIKKAVDVTISETEKIPHMGTGGLEKIKYPHETLHEIITNAVIHRDYSIADDIHVRIFDNRIEVQSPGRLAAHVTTKNILTERFARNGQIVRLLNKFPDPPNRDVGEGLNTAFEKMHALGFREPQIEERDNDVLVTIRHELLASPEQTIKQYLENHATIRNKQAREITHIRDSDKMKRILSKMAARGEIESVPGARFGATAYRKKGAITEPANQN